MFLWLVTLSVFSCASFPSVYLLLKDVSSGILLINQVAWLFTIELYELLIYFGCWLSRSVVSDTCNPMDCSLPGSSVHGIFQARILEWGAISFFRGTSQPRDWTQVSYIAGGFFTSWSARGASSNHLRVIQFENIFSHSVGCFVLFCFVLSMFLLMCKLLNLSPIYLFLLLFLSY